MVMYNFETGKPELHRGAPMPRAFNIPPPCKRICPKGGPETFSDLLPQNVEAVQHFLECSAVGQFPTDPIVAKNASILRQVEKAIERGERREDLSLSILRASLPTMNQPVTKRARR